MTNNMDMMLEIQLEDERHQDLLSEARVSMWVKAALDGDVTSAEIAVRIVGEAEGLELNKTYRGKDYATNVLTFDYTHAPNVTADLIICAPVIEHEAVEQNKTLEAHYAHMLVHGILHAQGWDHEDEEEAQAMEALEVTILKQLGYPSPYED